MPDEQHLESEETGSEPDLDTQEKCDPLANARREYDELTDTLKRLQAEFENYKKRADREWNERMRLACERLVSDLLPVLDAFDKAVEGTKADDGIISLHRKLLGTLERAGLKEVDCSGRLDPFVHEVLMTEQTMEGEDGAIAEVFQKGYYLGPKVIRSAKVKVLRREEPRRGRVEGERPEHHDHNEDEDEPSPEDEKKE
jgi:molecular chaperone GrpE